MKHRPQPGASEETDSFAEGEAYEPGYRVAHDVVHKAELEQQVLQLKDRLQAYEREVYAARKAVQRRRVMHAVSVGGIGATLGLALAAALDVTGVISSADAVVFIAGPAFILGLVSGMRWSDPDDNFPAAPPPRMQRPL